jgi:hypothetical protein
MRRSSAIVLATCLAIAAVLGTGALVGCAPDTRAQTALAKGNAALAAYAKADEEIAQKIAKAAVVQPTPSGVKPGLALLSEVSKAMPARQKEALTAKVQFQAFKAAAADDKQRGYADRAIALADGLVKLDLGTIALTKNMTELYQSVAKNSSDTERVVKLADAVTKGQVTYDELRAKVKTLSDAADAYYQSNLAGKKQ